MCDEPFSRISGARRGSRGTVAERERERVSPVAGDDYRFRTGAASINQSPFSGGRFPGGRTQYMLIIVLSLSAREDRRGRLPVVWTPL